MANAIIFCVFNLAIFFEVSQGQLDSCTSHCQGSYSFEQTEANSACLRGCRFSTITQLTLTHRETEDVNQYCKSDCSAAYSTSADLLNACSVGCDHQKILPTPDAIYEAQDEVDSYFTLHPVVVFRRYCLGMLDEAASLWHVRTSVFVDETSGSSVVMKIETSDASDMGPVPFLMLRDEELRDGDARAGDSLVSKAVMKSHHWLSCVEAKAGIPRWVLLSVLLLAALCILSVFCNPTEDSVREKVHSFDKEFLAPPDYDYAKVPLYAVATVDEAGPLPEKVPLLANA